MTKETLVQKLFDNARFSHSRFKIFCFLLGNLEPRLRGWASGMAPKLSEKLTLNNSRSSYGVIKTTPFPWAKYLNSGFKIHKKTQTMRLVMVKQLRLWNRSIRSEVWKHALPFEHCPESISVHLEP